MPNEEIVAKIEELKRICDPNENEAKLVLELKQINDKIINIQKELAELENTPDALFYDEIQESRDATRKAELQRQIKELEKKASILEMELTELKEKEAKKVKELQELQQNKNENIARASIMKDYLETLESISAKENTENILKEVEKKVDEDTDFFKRLAEEYQEIQEEIEQKVTLLEETNNKRKDLNAQLEQLSKDLANNESYINKEKKEETANRISELKEEMNNLQARQGEIVSDLIMLVSRAHQAALDGEMVSILNKIKAVKEALLQKTFMEIPEDSIQDEVAKAIEERQTFYNQISGKNYELSGLSAADERIEELNASLARWTEEMNNLQAKKDEIDNGTKYGSARKIEELNTKIATQEKEVEEFSNKENLTNEEIAALDKRKKEIAAQKEVLNRYFADQSANIEEATIIETNIEMIKKRMEAAKVEIKELRKKSKSLAGIDLLSKIKDNNELQTYVKKVMDLKKLPEYKRMLVIVDEVLETLGKDIVVPQIEEQEEKLTTSSEIQSSPINEKEKISEVHPIEEVQADEIKAVPSIKEVNTSLNKAESNQASLNQSNTGVLFEQAFKESSTNVAMSDELNKEINRVLNDTANNGVSFEEKKKESNPTEIVNPFANINDLKPVEGTLIQESVTKPLKVESQETIGALASSKKQVSTSIEPAPNVVPQSTTQKVVNMVPTEPQVTNIQPDNSFIATEPSTNSIDDFFAAQWGEVSEGQTLGKVA